MAMGAPFMPGLLPNIDPQGLLEYSVVYTDRALNHMSQSFQQVMRDISETLKKVYNAHSVVVVPGSGTFGMEAVARQFATNQKCLILRNGWFSFRWSQILEMGSIASEAQVLKARPVEKSPTAPFVPPPVKEVIQAIREHRPNVVFAPHVETSSGMILPDDYIAAVGNAVAEVGGLFVLDCIASGTIWVDMEKSGVDVLISAPQKGWSGSPGCALVMLSKRAKTQLAQTTSTSFACDLRKWSDIMQAYENGGHAYHATMPTDALRGFRDVMKQAQEYGFEKLRHNQQELGDNIRHLLSSHGIKSVAAQGFGSPGVVVCYTDDPAIKSGRKFAELGIQIAAGVPLKCNEPDDFQTFRLGLFGLDKLQNLERTVETFERALVELVGRPT